MLFTLPGFVSVFSCFVCHELSDLRIIAQQTELILLLTGYIHVKQGIAMLRFLLKEHTGDFVDNALALNGVLLLSM